MSKKVLAIESYIRGVHKCAVGQYFEKIKERIVEDDKMDFFNVLSMGDWFKLFFRRESLVHFQYPVEAWGNSLFPGFFGFIFASRFFTRKYIITMHEWQRMNCLRKLSIVPFVFFANGIIFVSPREKIEFEKNKLFGLINKKISVIPIGVNITRHDICLDEIMAQRENLLSGGFDFICGVFGFIYKAKQIEKTIESLVCMKSKGFNPLLLICGDVPDGGDEYKKSILRIIEKNNLEGNVKFYGYIEDEVLLARLLSSCNAVVQLYDDGLSSRRSSFWYTSEMGIPCVTTYPEREDEFDFIYSYNPYEDKNTKFVKKDCLPIDISNVLLNNFSAWSLPAKRICAPSWEFVKNEHKEYYSNFAI